MTRKIGIIGTGHVGGAVAEGAIFQGLADDYVLIDSNPEKLDSEVLDLIEAQPNLKHHANIISNDWDALDDADVIISALGNIGLQKNATGGNARFIEAEYNAKQLKSVAAKLKATKFNGVLVVITNPNDVIVTLYQKLTGFPKEKVIGTGTLLDTARMKNAVGETFDVDPRSVQGYNLGEHGNSQFTAWSTVKILDESIEPVAAEKGIDLNQIANISRDNGYRVLNGKGYTSYAIAASALRLTETILNDSHEELPVSTFREGHEVALSYPAVIGRDGVLGHGHLHLTDEEETKLTGSYDFVTECYHLLLEKIENDEL
ncbi:L-lactate dehydrogenase [Weissella viridescens]|uniref:L-lactate dehydrogenase n=1 Tax=Weissella viridescens TaxID=1629 RepID=UPI0040564C10